MRVLIFIKGVYDTKVSVECDILGGLRTDWNVPTLDSADGAAIALALKLKDESPETHISLVHLGPISGERYIREGIAYGCDDGTRVWDKNLQEAPHAHAKAFILARVAQILTYDLILTGTQSRDSASAQLGILVASILKIPCITRAVALTKKANGTIEILRKMDEGYRERIQSPMPAVVTMGGTEEPSRYTSFPHLFECMEREISCLDLSEIGISSQELRRRESLLSYGPLRFPSSRLKPSLTLDASLPANQRREILRTGSVAARKCKMVSSDDDSIVEAIFQDLLRGGWLDHLRKL